MGYHMGLGIHRAMSVSVSRCARNCNRVRTTTSRPQSACLYTTTTPACTNSALNVSLGLDFGTESMRAVLVALDGSGVVATASRTYTHGQITPYSESARNLELDVAPTFALQHPSDWLRAASDAVADVLAQAPNHKVTGIGIDFTSCTMIPCFGSSATPLCMDPKFRKRPHAWPKLWKHHGAATQASDMTAVAKTSQDSQWLDARYGGVVGLEWLFPKALEVFDNDREVYDTMDDWVEAGDWISWQLTGTKSKSACQAGYKAFWCEETGYPPASFFNNVRTDFGSVLGKVDTGKIVPPGEAVGGLRSHSSLTTCQLSGFCQIEEGTPVSAAAIDAHAGVPGVGVAVSGTMVLVLGTSGCYMLNHHEAVEIPGVAGVVNGGIVPGLVGYETGQAALGDSFAWVSRFTNRSLAELDKEAEAIAPGASGVEFVDFLNGCRTPLMDGSLTGSARGLSLHTGAGELHRAVAEAMAMGCRRTINLFEDHGVTISKLVATGGLAHNAFFRQILADVLQRELVCPTVENGPAIGAAIYGASASGVFEGGMKEAVETMVPISRQHSTTVTPNRKHAATYNALFSRYLSQSHPTVREQASLTLTNTTRHMSTTSTSPSSSSSLSSLSSSSSSSSQTETQPAAFIHGARDVRIGPLAIPTLQPNYVQLSVDSVGICGSDLHYFKDGGIGSDAISQPFVPGHEFAARLIADDDEFGPAGTLVAVDPGCACDECEWCMQGHHNLCARMRFIGAPPNQGALTTIIQVPRKTIYTVPETMTSDQVSLLEPLGIAIHAVSLAKPKSGEDVAILGAGPIGLLILQVLLQMDIAKNIFVCDPIAFRAETALKYGATASSTSHDVMRDFSHRGCGLVIEATNSTNGFRDAVLCAKTGGRVVLVGIPDGNEYASMPADVLRRRALDVRMSRRMARVMPQAIKLIAEKKVDVDKIITHRFELQDTAQAFECQAQVDNGVLKTLVHVRQR